MPSYQMQVLGTIRSPYKQKFAIPRQPGLIAEARGRYVLFLDADDTLEPTALERLLAALDADPNATYLLGQLRRTYARRLELTQRAAGATPA